MRFEANFSLTADFEIAQRADMYWELLLARTRTCTSQTNYTCTYVIRASLYNNEKRTNWSAGMVARRNPYAVHMETHLWGSAEIPNLRRSSFEVEIEFCEGAHAT